MTGMRYRSGSRDTSSWSVSNSSRQMSSRSGRLVSSIGSSPMPSDVGALMLAPALITHPRLARSSKGHTVQPVPEQLRLMDRAGPSGQNQERGLKGVLGGVPVADDMLAHAEYHRPVPANQDREGDFRHLVAIRDESRQQLTVAQLCGRFRVQQSLAMKRRRPQFARLP